MGALLPKLSLAALDYPMGVFLAPIDLFNGAFRPGQDRQRLSVKAIWGSMGQSRSDCKRPQPLRAAFGSAQEHWGC